MRPEEVRPGEAQKGDGQGDEWQDFTAEVASTPSRAEELAKIVLLPKTEPDDGKFKFLFQPREDEHGQS